MPDNDKKVVNTEEQNRTVNPGDSVIQEDSISQEPAHDSAIDKHRETRIPGSDRRPVLADMDDDQVPDTQERIEGDDASSIDRNAP